MLTASLCVSLLLAQGASEEVTLEQAREEMAKARQALHEQELLSADLPKALQEAHRDARAAIAFGRFVEAVTKAEEVRRGVSKIVFNQQFVDEKARRVDAELAATKWTPSQKKSLAKARKKVRSLVRARKYRQANRALNELAAMQPLALPEEGASKKRVQGYMAWINRSIKNRALSEEQKKLFSQLSRFAVEADWETAWRKADELRRSLGLPPPDDASQSPIAAPSPTPGTRDAERSPRAQAEKRVQWLLSKLRRKPLTKEQKALLTSTSNRVTEGDFAGAMQTAEELRRVSGLPPFPQE